MKPRYFIKFDRRVNKIIGCQRTTLILSTLEYWFSKKQEGFYKFIEPCSHPLYKKEDSWTEELDCDPKSFTNSFRKIGVKYKSRTAFEKTEDKFQGKMYASFYDRYSNRVFFVRNDEEVSKFFAGIYPPIKVDESQIENKENSQSSSGSHSLKNLLRNGKNSRSYKEPKNSSDDLSKDKSHAEEIIKKMIEIWTALVEEGKEQVKLGRTTVPFLKKAFSDKFDSCLEKWRKFCHDIASSRFLMGEKTPFKAKLDWAILFKNIEKVFDGQYGIGDRTPKTILASQADLQEEILASEETQEIKAFRTLCLNTVGNAKYISYFKKLSIEFREEGVLALVAPSVFSADLLERNCNSYFRLIFSQLDRDIKSFELIVPGEKRGRLLEKRRERENINTSPTVSDSDLSTVNQHLGEEELEEDNIEKLSSQTKQLRAKLKTYIPPKEYPSWLSKIEVQSINENGILVAAFKDKLTVDYAKAKFFQVIQEAAKDLWSEVNQLIIQEKQNYLPSYAGDECEKTDKSFLQQQAFHSMMGADFSRGGQGGHGLNDMIPY